MKTAWPSALRLVLSSLAFVHSFPARKHLALFVAAPSVDEAWKGFGALVAVGLYCAPTSWYARGIALLVRRRRLFLAASMGMVVVHLVPALDHLPHLLGTPSWGDLWRGAGAAVAVAWFALPVRRQVALVQFLRGSARRGSNERSVKSVKAPSIVLAAMLVFTAGGIYACGQSKSAAPNTAEAGAPCVACVSDNTCNSGEICGQFGGDSYCAPLCPNGNECASDRTCYKLNTSAGLATQACVPNGDICGGMTPGLDAGPIGPPEAGTPFDGGSGVTGSVGPTGGTLSRLLFGVVGDTRPPTDNDTAGYPSKIINTIYSDIAATKPLLPFLVSTGDYMFAYPDQNEGSKQLALYLSARGLYSGTEFFTLGNHECTGSVDSNCGTGNKDGVTKNYSAFMTQLLAPLGKTEPYYSINVNAADGKSWTAKFVFIAANAWTAAQGTWLQAEMAKPTTYTFVVRHEPRDANTAPGVTPSEAIINTFPYTLAIVGHSHAYFKSGPKQVTIGNGGAPLMGGSYGYAVISQRADLSIQVDMIDYQTLLADGAFRFYLKPDGTRAQ